MINDFTFLQVKHMMGDEFRVMSASEKYRIRFELTFIDLIHPTARSYALFLNNLPFTTRDRDNDYRELVL